MAKKEEKINGEIVEIYEVIEKYDDESSLLLCAISWNDKQPRIELRLLRKNGHFGPGIPISKNNIKKLYKSVDLLPDSPVENTEDTDDSNVDFDDIFKKGSKISHIRNEGYVTKDSKIMLKRK